MSSKFWQQWGKRPECELTLADRANESLPEMESTKQLVSLVSEVYKPGMRILDVGCNVGHYLKSLRRVLPLQFYYSLAANPVLAAHLQEHLFPSLSITYVSGIAQAPTAGSWCRAGIAKLPRVPDRSTTCHQKGRTRGSSAEFTASHRFLWYLSAFILHLRESA